MNHIKFRIYIVSAVFIILISFPICNSSLKLVKDTASNENRQMTTKPELNIKLLDPFPEKYEKYYNDHFTLRSTIVKYYNLLNLRVFKKSPIPDKVTIGKGGWLFLAGNEMDAYRGLHQFTAKELEEFRLELEYRKNYLENLGCKFCFIIAPVKANIYKEYLPSGVYRINNQSWGEELNEYLNKYSKVKPIDLYDVFRVKKGNELLYLKLDNHWTEIGAFYAAREVVRNYQSEFPELELPELDNFIIQKIPLNTGNIVQMLGNTLDFNDIKYELKPKEGFRAVEILRADNPDLKNFGFPLEYKRIREIKDGKKPKILIISDSFGIIIYPIISEYFGKTVKIFDAWQYKLNEDIIADEKPDIVLLMVLESNLRNVLQYQSRPK
jgi:alginate O-acetyltransferase complex protein AlgJ